ncbi:hypothetical protein AB0N05_27630 [Nocardia sp. NPDC051030]|uniref:hypothetical protein n=1 Tax=Nocardia sp. NPDC051030 TaxID=3155162 RepID=UPI003434A061
MENYNVKDWYWDPDGKVRDQVRALGKLTVHELKDRYHAPTAAKLVDHYLGGTGKSYELDTATVDRFIKEDSTQYPNTDPPSKVIEMDRLNTMAAAVIETEKTGKPAKVTMTSPWQVVGGSSQDSVLSLGHYSISTTTVAIAEPGPSGQHRVQWWQEVHIYDQTVYGSNSSEYPGLQQTAINNLFEAEQWGIAKPFITWGTSSVMSGGELM